MQKDTTDQIRAKYYKKYYKKYYVEPHGRQALSW